MPKRGQMSLCQHAQNVPKSKFRRKSRQEQTAASKLRMERRGEKLDAAREKLAKQKPPKKPGAVKRLAHTAGHGVHGFVHGKLYEVEHENVGTEGAHRSELAAESVYRFGRRKLRKAIREHPAKAVERAESKHIKATADYYYRKTVEEHPEMQEGGKISMSYPARTAFFCSSAFMRPMSEIFPLIVLMALSWSTV